MQASEGYDPHQNFRGKKHGASVKCGKGLDRQERKSPTT